MSPPEDLTKERLIQDLITLRKRIDELETIKEEKQKYEDELAKTKSMFEGLFEFAPDAIIVIDGNGSIVRVNQQAERLFGYARNELLGVDHDVIVPDRFREKHLEDRRGYMSGPHIRQMGTGLELYGKRKDGSEFPVDIALGPLQAQEETVTVAVVRDFTERKRAEQALRDSEEALRQSNENLEQRVRERTMELQHLMEQLEKSRHELRKFASELVLAEERERKRIAGVLHDEIAQTLAAVRMRLDMLRDVPSDQKDKTLNEAKELLVESIAETRALMLDLGNPILSDLGLKAACEALTKRMMERHPVRITCDVRDAFKNLNPDVSTILYQVVRELLNNVIKHSRAQHAHVMIDVENEHCQVTVTDDGVGFEPQMLGAPTEEGGFGLYTIRERLIAVDGSLRIESSPGAGTVVTAILPVALD
jgi:PAS domain S-box-containing protein